MLVQNKDSGDVFFCCYLFPKSVCVKQCPPCVHLCHLRPNQTSQQTAHLHNKLLCHSWEGQTTLAQTDTHTHTERLQASGGVYEEQVARLHAQSAHCCPSADGGWDAGLYRRESASELRGRTCCIGEEARIAKEKVWDSGHALSQWIIGTYRTFFWNTKYQGEFGYSLHFTLSNLHQLQSIQKFLDAQRKKKKTTQKQNFYLSRADSQSDGIKHKGPEMHNTHRVGECVT